MSQIKDVVRALVWILPASQAKNRLLRSVGDDIHPSATARSCLVLRVTHVSMGVDSRIGRWNLLKNMRMVSIGEHASVGRMNVFSSHPVYKRLYPDGAVLEVGAHSFVTSRHQFDCSGSVAIGEYSSVAGHETKIVTHSIDVRRDAQAARPVRIGARSFVGARCLLLGGAVLPDRSVLAAGSVLARAREEGEPGLWAGVPAVLHGPIEGAWFERSATGTSRVYIPATGETVEDAF
jgi:acetyltransferase-like isoleucine patch superfamily enzyme